MVMDSRSRRAFEDVIRLDSEGNWYQGDFPILHERTCQFFYKHIVRDEAGKYYLEGEERPVYIKVEDVPYWVKKVERTIAGYLVSLTDESIELLDLNSLWIGKRHALYCVVKGGNFPAKFMRAPYYEITRDLKQRGKKYFLLFRGKQYPVHTSPPKDLTPDTRKSREKERPKTKGKGTKRKALKQGGRVRVRGVKHARAFKKAAKKKRA